MPGFYHSMPVADAEAVHGFGNGAKLAYPLSRLVLYKSSLWSFRGPTPAETEKQAASRGAPHIWGTLGSGKPEGQKS